MTFKEVLFSVIEELKNYNSAKLFEDYVEERLNNSVKSYYDTLTKSINNLNYLNDSKSLKKILKEVNDD